MYGLSRVSSTCLFYLCVTVCINHDMLLCLSKSSVITFRNKDPGHDFAMAHAHTWTQAIHCGVGCVWGRVKRMAPEYSHIHSQCTLSHIRLNENTALSPTFLTRIRLQPLGAFLQQILYLLLTCFSSQGWAHSQTLARLSYKKNIYPGTYTQIQPYVPRMSPSTPQRVRIWPQIFYSCPG